MNPLDPLTRLLPASLRPATWLFSRSEQGRRMEGVFLAHDLGVDASELASIRLGPRYHYRPLTVAKPDGRERRVLAPSPALKGLQRKLLETYLARLPVHPCATAFYPGASTVSHARPHARARVVATVDLRDFFESTRAARVRGFFRGQGWRADGLQTLMRLCTYRDGLPQGAPTSPCLSNLVNARLDARVHSLAQRSGALYTRYGDDLAFSWAAGDMPVGFTRAVEELLTAASYQVQPRKGWRVSLSRDQPVVTGIVLAGDGRLRVPWALRLRAFGLRWRSWWSPGAAASNRLRGYEGYLRMIDRAGPKRGGRSRRGASFTPSLPTFPDDWGPADRDDW